MLDVMSSSMQGPTAPTPSSNSSSVGNTNGRVALPPLQRGAYYERVRARQMAQDNIKKTMMNRSYPAKQMEWNVFWGKTGRPFQGLCCAACVPNSKVSFVTEAAKSASLKNVLEVEAQYGKGFLTRRLCHLHTVWNLKKYDYPQLSPTVLRDERLRQAVMEAAKSDMQDDKEVKEGLYGYFLKKHEERATRVVMKMRSTLSDFLLRLTSWILYKLLPCFLTSVAAHPGQVKMLEAAGATGLPLIFLPLHRSHLDYILISFILHNNNIRSPLVAAGNNLSIPVFGWLLRGLGAFFIKRRMDPVSGQRDTVYRAALHTYMIHCLRAGHNMEFYIEGGRTRTGKPSLPKGGLLSVVVDAYMDGTIEDALLVPVSVNYEKLVDGNFVRELLGQPKKMETFGSAVRGIWSVLNSNYGMMRIDFNQPFSLRELVQSFQSNSKLILQHHPQDFRMNDELYSDTNRNSMMFSSKGQMHHVPSSASLFGTDYVDDRHRLLVESIARHILYDAAKSTSIMSTNAVAFLLLNKHRCGTTLGNLVRSIDELRKELMLADRDVGFCGESIDVVNHAVDLLGPGLVRREKKILPIEGDDPEPAIFISPIIMLPNVIELSYYSNTVLLFYVMDSITATGLVSLLPFDMYKSDASQQTSTHSIRLDNLIEAAYELCEILQLEFIFTKPCQHLETVIMDRIDNLCTSNILLINNEAAAEDEKNDRPTRRMPTYFEYDSEEEELMTPAQTTKYTLNIERDALRRLDFLHGLLRPLVDTYAASASVLERLVSQTRSEKELIHDILGEVKVQLDSGKCQYGESLSVDPIKNSLKLFERWGILECHIEENIKLYYLSEAKDCEESVREIFNRINKYKWIIGSQ